MQMVAEALEQSAAKDGWDQTAFLGVVFRHRVPVGEMFEVAPFVIQPSAISDQPAQALLFLTGKMLTEDPPPLIPPNRQKDFAGVAFLAEGWQRIVSHDEMPPPDLEGRSFADIPGSKETRFVHVIDCAGRYYCVNRVRGQAPTSEVATPGGKDIRPMGNIAIGLRDMMVAIGRQLPFGSMDLDAVRSIAAEDMDDVISRTVR